MTVVVADTSPLNYLILIGEGDVLGQLYGDVLVPDVVVRELRDFGAPLQVLRWASQLPPWVKVEPAPVSAERLERLDSGERAAILLAEVQSSPVLLVIDDAEGRAGFAPAHPCHGNARHFARRGHPRVHRLTQRRDTITCYELPLFTGSV